MNDLLLSAAEVVHRSETRPDFCAFVGDSESAHTIRAALGPAFSTGLALHQTPFRTAVELLAGMTTPRTILVDISGEEQPLSALVQLESVVDAGTRVLVIGNNRSVGFYRGLTRNLGIKDYLAKPLDIQRVTREFLPWATGDGPATESARGGVMIAVCGAHGGAGATTIATNLAWLIGVETRRHTILLDADLHRGSTALATGVPPSTGLRTALEAPDRIDPLLIERAAHPAAERLHVLAAEEPLTETLIYRAGGGRALSAALRQRYNFVIADIPNRPLGFAAEILSLAQQRILVIDGTLRGIAGARRWLDLPAGPMQTSRPTIVLNRYQRGRHASAAKLADALGTEIEVVIPDLSPAVPRAMDLGEFPAAANGKFRNSILKLVQMVGGSSPWAAH